ncbi:MAG TPA: hypothetical protein VMB04_09480 [Mycobacterium sp.]|nr:hypothetical protein [Mycobacterium sp.]
MALSPDGRLAAPGNAGRSLLLSPAIADPQRCDKLAANMSRRAHVLSGAPAGFEPRTG